LVVAHEPTLPWRSTGPVTGVYERVRAEVDRLRPLGVHPNITPAQHVDVGVRATVVTSSGADVASLRTALTDQLATDVRSLRLGGDVLFSHVMRVMVDEPGVLDVRDLRLRRFPVAAPQVTSDGQLKPPGVIEAEVGENLALGPTEIARFRPDSDLFDLRMVTR
jgi:hypothetical protein